jgi:hypothetical protein
MVVSIKTMLFTPSESTTPKECRGVAVTSPHYTLNVSPVWVFLQLLEREGAASLFGLKRRNYFLKDAFSKALI